MSTTSIILRDDAKLSISFTDEAKKLKETALEMSALIARVSKPSENETAVQAQAALKTLISTVEKARSEVKAPILEYGRTIDGAAKGFTAELMDELTRISTLVGNFAALEQAKVRAAEAARKLEEEKLERQRQAEQQRIIDAERAAQVKLSEESAIASARLQAAKNQKEHEAARAAQVEIERQKALAASNSHDALDAVNEHFARKAESLPVVQAVRAEGQIVKNDWTIDVVDVWLLARCHRDCVDLKPRVSAIKELLKLGVKVQGVKATPITTANVRAGAERPAITI